MTTFTKVSNVILRGTIVAGLAAAASQVLATGAALINLFPEQLGAFGLTTDGTVPLTSLISGEKMLTAILLLATLCSFFAFRCAGKAASTVRTITLFGLTVLSTGGTFLFHVSDVLLRSVNGTASATELAAVKPILDAAAKSGTSSTDLAGFLTAFGIAVPALITAVLAVLTITSAVSLVKTIKRTGKNSGRNITASGMQSVQA